MLLHDFWFEYHQKWICVWRWHNCSFCRRALGIIIDSRLTVHSHLKQLCKMVADKLNALTRIPPHLSYSQRRLIYSSFFTKQFSYCSLIWTFYSKQSNYLINKLQERAGRVTYNDYDSSFSELLEMLNETTIHIKNIKVQMNEIYKFLNFWLVM